MLKTVYNLYLKYKEIINYLVVGGLTTIVSLFTYYILVFTLLNPNNGFQLQFANIFSWIAAVTFAYFTNRKYVFESKNNNLLKEAFSFYISRLSTLLMDMTIMYIGVTLLNGNDKIWKLIVQIVVTIMNYILSKFIVFKKNRTTLK